MSETTKDATVFDYEIEAYKNREDTTEQHSQKDMLSMHSQSDDDLTYNMRFMKKNKASFGKSKQPPKPSEIELKFQKQIELSQNDAIVIEQQ